LKQNTFRKSYFLIAGLLLGLTWLAATSWNTAAAQDGPGIAFLPEELVINLDEGNTAEAQIYVSNVTDMNAFDIELTYDSSVVTLKSYSFGGFFKAYYCLFQKNEPGRLWLVCMVLKQSESGSGSLVDLTFEAHGAGSTAVAFTNVDLSALNGVPIHAEVYDGRVTARYPTYSLAGTLRLQGRSVHAGVPVSLTSAVLGSFSTVTTDTIANNLAFGDLRKGSYTLTTHQPRYLNVHAGLHKTFSVSDDTTLPPLELKGGNARWDDNVIDVLDASLVGLYFGQPINAVSADADVNFDGVVNIYDLVMVAGNYGLTAEEAYADWLE
jgi:hypothetical protein